jgi:hypothetical protein
MIEFDKTWYECHATRGLPLFVNCKRSLWGMFSYINNYKHGYEAERNFVINAGQKQRIRAYCGILRYVTA